MLNLEVPQMGDSITEGSIASVLKSAGESVAEDEVVVQIETDKVTIDVRSPTQGVLNSVLVKVDETVTVGQHIAIIEEGAEGTVSATSTSSSSSSEAAAAPPAPAAAKEEEVSSATSATVTEHESRAPSIHFPARRTTDGKVISHLSMEDRAKLGLHHQQQQQEETPKQTVHVPMFTNLRGNTSWTNYKPNYEDHIKRRAISEREIESIMLGGAAD
jgi:2-oxoglutarate dehydrogenase E2 component (dihydrolipoamide succinyltransferase)